MVKKVNYMRGKGKYVVATTALGAIICAKGKASKIITEDMKNPNVSQRVLAKSAEVSKTISYIDLPKKK